MDFFNKEQPEIFKLEIDTSAKTDFIEMSRWTKFLAIIGFVFLGLFLAGGIVMGIYLPVYAEQVGGNSAAAILSLGPAVPVIFVSVAIIVTGVLFYPVLALIKYSNYIKVAMATDNKEKFNLAIKYLKNMYKYQGIVTIILIILYGIDIIYGLAKTSW